MAYVEKWFNRGNTVTVTTVDETALEAALLAAEGHKYQADLAQSGTAAPVPTVHRKDFSQTFTWARSGEGVYTLTANASAFTENKTSAIAVKKLPSDVGYVTIEWTSATVLTLRSFNDSDVASDIADSVNGGVTLHIHVHP